MMVMKALERPGGKWKWYPDAFDLFGRSHRDIYRGEDHQSQVESSLCIQHFIKPDTVCNRSTIERGRIDKINKRYLAARSPAGRHVVVVVSQAKPLRSAQRLFQSKSISM